MLFSCLFSRLCYYIFPHVITLRGGSSYSLAFLFLLDYVLSIHPNKGFCQQLLKTFLFGFIGRKEKKSNFFVRFFRVFVRFVRFCENNRGENCEKALQKEKKCSYNCGKVGKNWSCSGCLFGLTEVVLFFIRFFVRFSVRVLLWLQPEKLGRRKRKRKREELGKSSEAEKILKNKT